MGIVGLSRSISPNLPAARSAEPGGRSLPPGFRDLELSRGPIGPLAVATSARLALYGGGSYLRDRLTKEPATPEDLAKAVDSLVFTLENLAVNYLADVPGFVQDPLRHNLDGQLVDIDGRCK